MYTRISILIFILMMTSDAISQNTRRVGSTEISPSIGDVYNKGNVIYFNWHHIFNSRPVELSMWCKETNIWTTIAPVITGQNSSYAYVIPMDAEYSKYRFRVRTLNGQPNVFYSTGLFSIVPANPSTPKLATIEHDNIPVTVNISPNPGRSQTTIHFTEAMHSVEIICMSTGRRVLNRSAFHEQLSINTGFLNPGSYIVRATNESGVAFIKTFIIL